MCNMAQKSFRLSVTRRLPRGMFNNNDTERVVELRYVIWFFYGKNTFLLSKFTANFYIRIVITQSSVKLLKVQSWK